MAIKAQVENQALDPALIEVVYMLFKLFTYSQESNCCITFIYLLPLVSPQRPT